LIRYGLENGGSAVTDPVKESKTPVFMKLSAKNQPEAYEVKGRTVRCYHCSNHLFWTRRAQLNSAIATFFRLDWTDQSATCLICAECGYIHWFLA
jgi:uncharacterized protein with PIN domain